MFRCQTITTFQVKSVVIMGRRTLSEISPGMSSRSEVPSELSGLKLFEYSKLFDCEYYLR